MNTIRKLKQIRGQIKDKIESQLRAFTPGELLDFMKVKFSLNNADELETYYTRLINDPVKAKEYVAHLYRNR